MLMRIARVDCHHSVSLPNKDLYCYFLKNGIVSAKNLTKKNHKTNKERAKQKEEKVVMGIVKLQRAIFWMFDSNFNLADIPLWPYYTYIEVQIKVANTGSSLIKLNVSFTLYNSNVKCSR